MTPAAYASRLLASLGRGDPLPATDTRDAESVWRDCGGMWLTGLQDGPPMHCAAPVGSAMRGAWLVLSAMCPGSLDPAFDAARLVGERAAITGNSRRGRVSVGGACRLVQARNGWLALNLPRADDIALLPAWLEQHIVDPHRLDTVIRRRDADDLLARARLLGLAVARWPGSVPAGGDWMVAERFAPPAVVRRRQPLVLDLGSLWAAPLCGALLRDCGARVIKLESSTRPDGARLGPPGFFDLLNGGKQCVSLPLGTEHGNAALRALVDAADIVIEGSRPRALAQMGVDAPSMVSQGEGKVWVSITAYGRDPGCRDWIGFGDDVGVAAGLAPVLDGAPVFCADAIADPLAGIHAAVAAMNSWLAGGGELIDVSLYSVARYVASLGSTPSSVQSAPVLASQARSVRILAAGLGADTDAILSEFGMPSVPRVLCA